jgi:zinc transport system substrate-binding protein
MSPKMMQQQVRHIAKALQEAFLAVAATIEKNLELLLDKLQALDKAIQEKLEPKKGATIFVSHPAYGYLFREYDIKQVSIESEGKDPSPKQLTKLIDLAKKQTAKIIFVQKQYSTKAAELVASEVGATIVILDPYSENYFENMLYMASEFAKEPS